MRLTITLEYFTSPGEVLFLTRPDGEPIAMEYVAGGRWKADLEVPQATKTLDYSFELHRDGHLELQVKRMRPELQRLFAGLEPERDLRLLLRVFRTAHLEERVPRETVLGKVLERPIAELRPADGNAAVRPLWLIDLHGISLPDDLPVIRRLE